MLFRKLRIESPGFTQNKITQNWYMILRTVDDVLKYHNINSDELINDYICLPAAIERSHSANRMVQTITHLCEEYGDSPIQKLIEVIDAKGKRMIEMILSGQEILIQKAGGYCDYSGFQKIWSATVIDELEKDSIKFPVDGEKLIIETDLLYLENSKTVSESFEKSINEKFNITGVIYKLTELKYQELYFISGMIHHAKTIAIQSQFVDKDQIDRFLSIFVNLPKKRIIINSYYTNDLINRALYKSCEKIHEIIFI